MKKTFRLHGLDCANCAAKIERKISKLDGVQSASVNFMTLKMEIEAEDDKFDSIINEASIIAKKIEPDIIIKRA